MKAKSLTCSTSIEIMSKERFFFFLFLSLPSPFLYMPLKEIIAIHCMRHSPLSISDSTGYPEIHITDGFLKFVF